MKHDHKSIRFSSSGSRRPATSQLRLEFAGLSRSAAALFRLGTHWARLAAALLVVAGTLLSQSGAHALEQSGKYALYLDAPVVSFPQAEKAGETAQNYAGPDSEVRDDVLAWVDVDPVPQNARKAFASITETDEQSTDVIDYEAAVTAGDEMIAQLGGESPADGEDEEFASNDPLQSESEDYTEATSDTTEQDYSPDQQSSTEDRSTDESQELEYAAVNNLSPLDIGLPEPIAEAEESPQQNSSNENLLDRGDSGSSDDELAEVSREAGPISDDYSPKTFTSDSPDSPDSPGLTNESADEDKNFGEPDTQMLPTEQKSTDDEGNREEPSPAVLLAPTETDDSREPRESPKQQESPEPEGPTERIEPSEEYAAIPENSGSGTQPSGLPSLAPSISEQLNDTDEEYEFGVTVPEKSGSDDTQDIRGKSPLRSDRQAEPFERGTIPLPIEEKSEEPGPYLLAKKLNDEQNRTKAENKDDTSSETSKKVREKPGESEPKEQLSVDVGRESKKTEIRYTSEKPSSESQPKDHSANNPKKYPPENAKDGVKDEDESLNDASDEPGQNQTPRRQQIPQPGLSKERDVEQLEDTSKPKDRSVGDDLSSEQRPSSGMKEDQPEDATAKEPKLDAQDTKANSAEQEPSSQNPQSSFSKDEPTGSDTSKDVQEDPLSGGDGESSRKVADRQQRPSVVEPTNGDGEKQQPPQKRESQPDNVPADATPDKSLPEYANEEDAGQRPTQPVDADEKDIQNAPRTEQDTTQKTTLVAQGQPNIDPTIQGSAEAPVQQTDGTVQSTAEPVAD